MFAFQHYDSAAHEVLGVARGKARLMLGGENGREVTVRAGDVVVLPAGTGCCEIAASADLLTVSACPPDQHCDVCHVWPSEQARHRMAHLPFIASETRPVSIRGYGYAGAPGILSARRFW